MAAEYDDHDDILAAAAAGDVDEMAAVLSMDNRLTRARDAHGRVALHLAAMHGHDEAVALLLHNNADPNVRDTDGQTPLALARAAGHEHVAIRLHAGGAR